MRYLPSDVTCPKMKLGIEGGGDKISLYSNEATNIFADAGVHFKIQNITS
jgi:hypothetical protein